MRSYKFFIPILSFFLLAESLKGQGVIITPPVTHTIHAQHQPSGNLRNWGILDTLDLPFFDDFTSTEVLPDKRLWTGRQVYVNRTFADNPPSYGVATFDHLDHTGAPWTAINPGRQVACDTLASQPINLRNYRSGINVIQYRAIDSVYLSFYYQPQGLGDNPELSDSLVLQFRINDTLWRTVWTVRGSRNRAFRQIVVPVLKEEYFHAAFQFRFINYSMATGNLNHWHLDYVRMNRNRRYDDTLVRDVAINRVPGQLLRRYNTMPYRQFLPAMAAERDSFHSLGVRNLNPQTVQTQFQYIARNINGDIIAQSLFAANNRNVLGGDDTLEYFETFPMNGLPGLPQPEVDLEYRINPLSNDQTPDLYNTLGNNNSLRSTHLFTPWLAYDDGSAEGGFGLDYSHLGNIRGQCAIRYQLNVRDTLRGVAVFFNRSREDVSSRPFTLCVWKGISEPPSLTDRNDQLLWSVAVTRPLYTDSLQKFTYFMFDTALILEPGSFYVGWRQNTPFILNVGYDNNYRYAGRGGKNAGIFYNFYGRWEAVGPDVTGAPMLRPLLGADNEFTFSNPKQATKPELAVYPNPVQGNATLYYRCSEPLINYSLRDISGRLMIHQQAGKHTLDLPSGLPSGLYLLSVQTRSGAIVHEKIQIH